MTGLPHGATVGFYGKIPARGDFVRAGLKRDFFEPWDEWLRHGIGASRAALGEDWLAAWLEAPIWRFALSPGLCGGEAVLGLFLPSVDRAGRHFPLTLAACAPGLSARAFAAGRTGFLDSAEQAGLAALEQDLAPDALSTLVTDAATRAPEQGLPDQLAPLPDPGSLWWTEGSPRVAAGAWHCPALPEAEQFAGMLAGLPFQEAPALRRMAT